MQFLGSEFIRADIVTHAVAPIFAPRTAARNEQSGRVLPAFLTPGNEHKENPAPASDAGFFVG